MVLQRDKKIKIWGWAPPGEKVELRFRNQQRSATADAGGKWEIMLMPMKAGGPFTMDISAGDHVVLNNILVGDVWVCSGQSNMVLPMERVKEKYADVIAHAANPAIRQFLVPMRYDFSKPQEDLAPANWESADPQTVLHFTATGYFFARALFEKYHVPIGLINASVGGTPVESWMSEDALKAFPAYLDSAEKYSNNSYTDSIRKADEAAANAWNDLIRQKDPGLQGPEPWYEEAFDASDWQEADIPGYWDEQELSSAQGVVWYKKEIDVPAGMTGKPAKLWLGRIVDRDFVYVNGKLSGTTGYQYPPRRYELPPDLLRPGKNEIVIRVINYAGRGGFIKDKPYELTAGGKTIDLKGKWKCRRAVDMPPLPPQVFIQYQPLGLFNGMIAPLLHYAIEGVIWYQGESNTSRSFDYRDLFSAMITDWRKKWKQGGFPFLYVQLPNYGVPAEQPAESGWAALREAQLQTLALPNTAMAVTIDAGEWNDLHPLDKQDVGERLASAAQRLAYGDQQVVYSGPLYQSMKVEGNRISIRFSHTGSGLVARGGKLHAFTIAGRDGRFVPAEARIERSRVIVWKEGLEHPVAVRYAWADNPAGANLYNREGLPASPFRTDADGQNN
jgi:sialate O-acetylesterase